MCPCGPSQVEIVIGQSEHLYPEVWGGGQDRSAGSPLGWVVEDDWRRGRGPACRGLGARERGHAVRELGALGTRQHGVWEEEAAGEAGAAGVGAGGAWNARCRVHISIADHGDWALFLISAGVCAQDHCVLREYLGKCETGRETLAAKRSVK